MLPWCGLDVYNDETVLGLIASFDKSDGSAIFGYLDECLDESELHVIYSSPLLLVSFSDEGHGSSCDWLIFSASSSLVIKKASTLWLKWEAL